MPNGSQAFFQVAVGLIPGLIFGGALLERRAGEKRAVAELPRWPRNLIMAFLVIGVCAQIIAIRGVIDPDVGKGQQYVVVGVVVAGTLGIAVMTAWLLGVAPGLSSRRAGLVIIVTIAVAAVLAEYALSGSIDRANARLFLSEASDRTIRAGDDRNTARADGQEARAALVNLLDDRRGRLNPRRTRQRVNRTVQTYLSALDANSPSDDDIMRRATITKAFEALDHATEQALTSIQSARLSTSFSEVVTLAIERLSDAHAHELTARQNTVAARLAYEQSCREAKIIGCRLN